MTDNVSKLEKQVAELISALFQVAHDLRNITERDGDAALGDLKSSLRSAGDSLNQSLIALNDGCGPTGKIGE